MLDGSFVHSQFHVTIPNFISFILLLLLCFLCFPSRMSCSSSLFSWSPSFSWWFVVLSRCSYYRDCDCSSSSCDSSSSSTTSRVTATGWFFFFLFSSFISYAVVVLLLPLIKNDIFLEKKKTHTNHQSVWFIWIVNP